MHDIFPYQHQLGFTDFNRLLLSCSGLHGHDLRAEEPSNRNWKSEKERLKEETATWCHAMVRDLCVWTSRWDPVLDLRRPRGRVITSDLPGSGTAMDGLPIPKTYSIL